jgi:molybdopterin molybdotransferase
VAIVTTGSELAEPGEPLPPGHTRNSNRYSLAAQVAWCGAALGPVRHVPDEPDPVRAALRECAQADVIVTSCGVSVGDFDLVKQALADVGRIEFWQVAIRPGKPLVFGEIEGKPLFGLPGNPVSSMVSFEVFVRPALDQMRGLPPRPRQWGRLAAEVRHKPDRRTYLRALVVADNGALAIHPAEAQGSGQISSLVQANALAIIPEGVEMMKAGERAELIPLWDSRAAAREDGANPVGAVAWCPSSP